MTGFSGMLRLFLSVILGVASCSAAWPAEAIAQAQDADASVDALIDKAKQAFDDGDYATAIEAYEKLVMQAPNDSRVLYNLGTAHAWAGHRGLAIWRLLQSRQLDPRNPDTRANLRLIAPERTQSPLGWVYNQFSPNEWAALAGGALLLALLLGALYYSLRRGHPARPRLRPLLWALALVALVSWPFALMHYYQRGIVWQAVVVEDDTVAYTGPSENQIENFKLRTGTVIKIEDASTPGWVKFSYAGGRRGFVQRVRVRDL